MNSRPRRSESIVRLCDHLRRLLLMVSGVVPGMVKTELWDKMGQSRDQQKDTFEKAAKGLPVGFVGEPDDVS